MTTPNTRPITLHDMSLRDGMHPKRHQISLEQMIHVACLLYTSDAADEGLV